MNLRSRLERLEKRTADGQLVLLVANGDESEPDTVRRCRAGHLSPRQILVVNTGVPLSLMDEANVHRA